MKDSTLEFLTQPQVVALLLGLGGPLLLVAAMQAGTLAVLAFVALCLYLAARIELG